MKKYLKQYVCFLLFLTSGIGFAQTQKGFEIKVQLKNMQDSILYMGHYFGTSKYKDDSVYLKKGVYTFQGDKKWTPGLYFLFTAHGALLTDFIMDENQHFTLTIDTSKSQNNIIVKGSEDNTLFYKNRDDRATLMKEGNDISMKVESVKDDSLQRAKYIEKLRAIQSSLEKLNQTFIDTYPNHLLSKILMASKEIDVPEAPASIPDSLKQLWRYEYYKNHYFDNIDFSDNRIVYTPVYDDGKRFSQYFDKMLIQDPDTLIKESIKLIERSKASPDVFKYTVSMLTNKYGSSEIMGMDAVWVALAEKYYIGRQCDWVSDAFIENYQTRVNRLKPILIGSRPPELIFVDTTVNQPNENYVSIYSPKTRFTILIFWEPGCGHCKKELPKLKELYLKDKDLLDLEIIAVTTEPDVEKWKQFIHEHQLSFINLYGYKANRADWKDVYDVISTPTVYVFDKNKKIIAKRIGAEQMEDFLKWYMKTHP